MDDSLVTALITTLNRVADALERNTESNAALFGLLMAAEPEPQVETSVIPHTLDD